MSRAEGALLPELRDRIRRIERPAATVHGVLPFGIMGIDRALPGGRDAPRGGEPPAAARRRTLRHHRFSVEALARGRAGGARTHSTERGDNPMADRRNAVDPSPERAGGGAAALAGGASTLPRR